MGKFDVTLTMVFITIFTKNSVTLDSKGLIGCNACHQYSTAVQWARNRKVVKPYFDSRCGSTPLVLG